MTENERYEQKVLTMIQESATWSYWAFDSRRMMAAMWRLIDRGVITRDVLRYPMWRFTIAGD